MGEYKQIRSHTVRTVERGVRIMNEKRYPLTGKRFTDSLARGKARCEIGWNWHPSPLPDYDLWYVVSGRGSMRIGSRSYELRKGACFVVHPGDRPQVEQDPEDRLTVVYIHFNVEEAQVISGSTETVAEARADGGTGELLPERVVYLDETYDFEMLLHRTLECLYQQQLWAADEFDCLMKQLFIALYRFRQRMGTRSSLSKKQTQAVLRVIHRIHEGAGHRFPHEELARLAGLSPAYLSKIFKAYTGISLKEYMTRIRLERAMHLLTETSMNVSQVSDALGYSSVFLFSKQFKSQFGAPPSAYALSSVQSRPHR